MSHGVRVIRTDVSSAGASTSSSSPDSGRLDRAYASSCTAMLKVVQMLLLLIAFICIRNSVWMDHSAYSYFEIVTMCDFVMILVFYIVYLFRVYRLLTCINWPLAEFLHYLIGFRDKEANRAAQKWTVKTKGKRGDVAPAKRAKKDAKKASVSVLATILASTDYVLQEDTAASGC
ncbi:UNVERIFIED_CONTAM: hypothetical protein K2H54_045093 [Gekko kuhli]